MAGIISTGDELVPVEETPADGQIRDVNSAMLAALAEEAGAESICYGILKDGEETRTFTGAGTIRNPTRFDALPIVDVYGSGGGSVTIDETTVTISDIGGHVTLDSDLQDAFSGTQTRNMYVSAPEFPKLTPGATSVSFSGGVSSVRITPRWWVI